MSEEGKSGKRVVLILLGLAIGASLVAWYGASVMEGHTEAEIQAATASVVAEGVLYEARAGEPGLVVATEAGSGKELWRAELGNVTSKPALTVNEEVIEVQIAGTPWMTLDRSTGEPQD